MYFTYVLCYEKKKKRQRLNIKQSKETKSKRIFISSIDVYIFFTLRAITGQYVSLPGKQLTHFSLIDQVQSPLL